MILGRLRALSNMVRRGETPIDMEMGSSEYSLKGVKNAGEVSLSQGASHDIMHMNMVELGDCSLVKEPPPPSENLSSVMPFQGEISFALFEGLVSNLQGKK